MPLRRRQFTETLCHVFSPEAPARRPLKASEIARSATAAVPLRILIADDSPVNQKVTLVVLRRMGHSPTAVGNGLEAIQELERSRYDLVLMDGQMPVMDGYEAARQICKRWPERERPILVALTANAVEGDRELCLQAGMDDYLPKPLRPRELEATLMRWAAGRPSRPGNPLQALSP